MSFVGPRPERPEMIQAYERDMPEFRFRTRVKAGLTGYAQVYGKYNTSPYDKLKLDLFYIENYSLWQDIKLILMTLKTVLKPSAAEGVPGEQPDPGHRVEGHRTKEEQADECKEIKPKGYTAEISDVVFDSIDRSISGHSGIII